MNPPIDHDAIDARRAALKARVLAFIHEGYALVAEAEQEFKVKIPVELYQGEDSGVAPSMKNPGEPPEAIYKDAMVSAEDFFRGHVTIDANADIRVHLGDLGDGYACLEGVVISTEDADWLRWVSAAHISLKDALGDIREVHNGAFSDDYDAYMAEQERLAIEASRRIAERNARMKPAPEEFDPFNDGQ